MTKHKLKKDRYVHTRGGNSHLLDIHCSGCKAYLLLYQKDGHGSLLRLYLDRIFAPPELQMLQFRYQNKKDMPNLACAACKTLIGTPMVYERENRLAFRLVLGSFIKTQHEGSP